MIGSHFKYVKHKRDPLAISKYNFPSQSGGKEAITRILQAYGFSTRQALCDHLGVSQSTMANRWMRDTFPHDWLIACHLDTGASMLWLTTGQGTPTTKIINDNGLLLQLKKSQTGFTHHLNRSVMTPALSPRCNSSVLGEV